MSDTYPMYTVWWGEGCKHEQDFTMVSEACEFYNSLRDKDKCIMKHEDFGSSPHHILAQGFYKEQEER